MEAHRRQQQAGEGELGDDGDERARLRAVAMGPCKQACLLLGDMAFMSVDLKSTMPRGRNYRCRGHFCCPHRSLAVLLQLSYCCLARLWLGFGLALGSFGFAFGFAFGLAFGLALVLIFASFFLLGFQLCFGPMLACLSGYFCLGSWLGF